MRSITLPLVGLALALGAGHAAVAQDAAPEHVLWSPDFDEALKAAKEAKQPVLVAVLAGPEEERTTFLKTLDDVKVRLLSKKVVCVAAAEGVHAGGEGDRCPIFPGLTCAQHAAAYKAAEKKRLLAGTRRVCQHVFVSYKGKPLFKRGFGFEGDEGEHNLARRMNIALRLTDKSAVDEELAERESLRMDVLMARVRERDPEGRRAASAVLANSDDPDAIKAVARAAKTTGNDDDRAAIYSALAIRGNWSALAVLTAGLGDRDNIVRLAAIESIETIDMPDGAMTLLKQSKRDRALLASAMAIKGACFLDPQDKKVVAGALGASKHNRVTVRIGACWGMSAMVGNQTVINRLRQILNTDKEATARAAAAWALGVLGEELDATLISKRLEKEEKSIEAVKEAMQAAVGRLNGSTADNYDELIERLLAMEGVEDITDGRDPKGKWGKGKWGKWAGKFKGGKGGKGGWGGGGWGGKGGGGWGGKGGKGGKGG